MKFPKIAALLLFIFLSSLWCLSTPFPEYLVGEYWGNVENTHLNWGSYIKTGYFSFSQNEKNVLISYGRWLGKKLNENQIRAIFSNLSPQQISVPRHDGHHEIWVSFSLNTFTDKNGNDFDGSNNNLFYLHHMTTVLFQIKLVDEKLRAIRIIRNHENQETPCYQLELNSLRKKGDRDTGEKVTLGWDFSKAKNE